MITLFKRKTNRRKITKKATAAIFMLALIVTSLSLEFYATAIKVISDSVTRDDIAKQLEDAAYVNVVVNTMSKCVASIGGNDGEYIPMMRGKNAEEGKIMIHGTTDISTSLQIEGIVQGKGSSGWDGGNGTIWCYQGEDGGTSIFQLFAKVMADAGISMKEILCDGGQPGLIQRVDNSAKNCEHFEDDTAGLGMFDCGIFGSGTCVYWMSSGEDKGKAHLQKIYEKFYSSRTSDPTSSKYNPYLPTWGEIGSFNNVDGYFLYIKDFNYRCSFSESSADPHSDWSPVVLIDRSDKKIEMQRKYYHISSTGSWGTALSSDHPAKSCEELLAGVERLRKNSNEVENRSGGYQGIITAELKKACAEAKTSDGQNAWEVAKTKLEEVIADGDSSDDLKAEAQKNLDELNTIMSSGNYVKTEGNIDSDDKMTLECYDPEAFDIDVAAHDPAADPDDLVDGDTKKEPSCYDNAGSLGWIVCPIINQLSDFIQGAYEALVVPFMVLDAGLFTNSAAQNVWEVFRNFANTAFIILFLVVIFSQLTGVGIDNYGIKKILPKLFVTAVLVNLSYIICQLAVDVSNIIGKSIGDLLSLDAGEFSMSEVPDAKVDLGAGAIVVQVIAGVVALGIVLTKGVAIIVPVLMGLLSIAIAIFFLFVLLAVRKAFALILVIVSPMAFVCYALPNTKKIFDRWFNTFKGLLLAFPICSAMVYGGQFAAKIILMSAAGCSTDAKGCGGAVAFSLILTAAVISIVPIFMIPKVLRASMGAIAMGIGRMQHGLTGRGRGAIARSGMADSLRRTQARRNAGLRSDGSLNWKGKLQDARQKHGLMTRGKQARIAAGRDAALAEMGAANRIGNQFGAKGKDLRATRIAAMDANQKAQDVKDYETSIATGTRSVPVYDANGKATDKMVTASTTDISSMQNGLVHALRTGDETAIKAYQNALSAKGEDGREAVRGALLTAQKSGELSADSVRTFSSNLMENHAKDYKNNSRSLYDFANSTQNMSAADESGLATKSMLESATMRWMKP